MMFKEFIKTGKIMTSKKYGINYQSIIDYLSPLPKDMSLYHIHHRRPLCTFYFENEDGTQNIREIQKAMAPENHEIMLKEEHEALDHNALIQKYKNNINNSNISLI